MKVGIPLIVMIFVPAIMTGSISKASFIGFVNIESTENVTTLLEINKYTAGWAWM